MCRSFASAKRAMTISTGTYAPIVQYRILYTKFPFCQSPLSAYPKFNIFINRSFVFSHHNTSFFMSIFFGVTRTPIEICAI